MHGRKRADPDLGIAILRNYFVRSEIGLSECLQPASVETLVQLSDYNLLQSVKTSQQDSE